MAATGWQYEGKAIGLADTGGAQRHPVDTEKLMEYWAHGKGAAKIQWGTPGDFSRCKVQLEKYVSPGILDGLCANLHHRAIGVWPGQEHGKNDHKG